MLRYRELDDNEKKIIVNKATEKPGEGVYEHHKDVGIYVCKCCDLPLFLSCHKFESSCGWPSFDDQLANAIEKKKDIDSQRTEILCVRCGGHLGHAFIGEKFTQKNIRHCVNSASLLFVPAFTAEGFERAIFAGGCFWGVEYFMRQEKGVVQVNVGYIGGKVVNPTYSEVCTGETDHAEAVEVIFDNKHTNYKKLAEAFFEIHDPTQLNAQGPDKGSQYRSAVFFLTLEQKDKAQQLLELLKNQGLRVVTEIAPASTIWPAEEYHQQYYAKNGQEPYCHKRVKRFS